MEQLVNFIIRPPRAEYDPKNDLLEEEFMLKGQWFQRKDLKVTNSRGEILQCSHYMPLVIPEGTTLPCVIYCHGNSGCRADASEAAIILLPSYITVFTLDFSGSGLSGGEHVTLGWYEKDDLQAVVNYLRTDGNVSCIGLWGRSMGAVTSLMYGAEDPSIAGMVLDSPFSDLVDLMMELVDTYKFRFPKFTVKFAIQYMRKVIQKKAKFDIMDLNTIKVAKSCFVPVLLGHAVEDDFINPHHTDRIYEAYVGDKNIIKFEGDHNSPRPQFYFDSITIFFHNVLNPPTNAFEGSYFDGMHDYFGKDSWPPMHHTGHNFANAPTGMGTSSTEDAINELRSKRPMSRTEVPSESTSNERQSGAEDGVEKEPASSSSDLISFDLSNGQIHESLAPTAIDDEYVEYPLDNFSDFPCNMEEEERMLMEAVMESLKDLETKHPHEEEQSSSNLDRKSPESSKKNDTVTTSNSENSGSSEASNFSSSESKNTGNIASKNSSSNSNISTRELTDSATPLLTESRPSSQSKSINMVETSSHLDIPLNMPSSSGEAVPSEDVDDMAGGTRATLTVQKNPSSNIIGGGLMNRWGLNFFKNSDDMKKRNL